MLTLGIFFTIASIMLVIISAASEKNRGVATFFGIVSIAISTLLMYGAGVYSNDPVKGVEYIFLAQIDEEVIVYQSYDQEIDPQSKRVVRIIRREDLQPGIQSGDVVVLTDRGIKKVLPKEEESSTR